MNLIYKIEEIVTKHLIIADLSYMQLVAETNTVRGGRTYAETSISKEPEHFGYTAVANARGRQTATDTQTISTVRNFQNLTVGVASARAIATARTDNEISRSFSFNSYTSIIVTNFNSN